MLYLFAECFRCDSSCGKKKKKKGQKKWKRRRTTWNKFYTCSYRIDTLDEQPSQHHDRRVCCCCLACRRSFDLHASMRVLDRRNTLWTIHSLEKEQRKQKRERDRERLRCLDRRTTETIHSARIPPLRFVELCVLFNGS